MLSSKIFGNRFIPVYTGNIVQHRTCFRTPTVYPCVYREHKKFHLKILLIVGLSLCIQGTLFPYRLVQFPARFIPVYTGNIVLLLPSSRKKAVYPCVYREHEKIDKSEQFPIGLSLCIQGTYQL